MAVFDFTRGLAVFGFMLWHAFDMFYNGNKYDEPLFRITILTRISFVMVSGLVLGLKDWSSYVITDHLGRSLKIMSFTFVMSVVHAIHQGSAEPIYAVFYYIGGGSGDFTFSILLSLGCIYLLLPLILKYFSSAILMLILLFGGVAAEIMYKVSIPEFAKFLIISLLFSYVAKLEFQTLVLPKIIRWLFIMTFIIVLFFITIDKNIYWYVRNSFLYQLTILFLFYGASCSIYSMSKVSGTFFVKHIEIFGQNSLFVYIFHYVLYLIVLLTCGINTSSIMFVSAIWLATLAIFYSTLQKTRLHERFAVILR